MYSVLIDDGFGTTVEGCYKTLDKAREAKSKEVKKWSEYYEDDTHVPFICIVDENDNIIGT